MLVVVSGVGLFAYYAKDAPSISQAQLQKWVGQVVCILVMEKFLLFSRVRKRTL